MPTTRELEASLEAYFRKSVRERLAGHVVKLAPTEKGVPDRLVMLPGGRMYLVELKADGGVLSPAQKFWHERSDALGTDVHVLTGRGEIYQWCSDRMAERDDEFDLPSKTNEYRRGYRAGVKAANKSARYEA